MPTCTLGCPWGQGLFTGILPKRSHRSAGAFCRDFTEKESPQCSAYTGALQMEKSISPLFPGPEGAVVANDWCINHGQMVILWASGRAKWAQKWE